jgi:hypothetical protein
MFTNTRARIRKIICARFHFFNEKSSETQNICTRTYAHRLLIFSRRPRCACDLLHCLLGFVIFFFSFVLGRGGKKKRKRLDYLDLERAHLSFNCDAVKYTLSASIQRFVRITLTTRSMLTSHVRKERRNIWRSFRIVNFGWWKQMLSASVGPLVRLLTLWCMILLPRARLLAVWPYDLVSCRILPLTVTKCSSFGSFWFVCNEIINVILITAMYPYCGIWGIDVKLVKSW